MTIHCTPLRIAISGFAVFWMAHAGFAAGDPERGAKVFGACAACHSLEPNRHMTGPSLADIFGRRAGTVEGFVRYSKPLKASKIVWNENTLNTWLKDPQALVPGNLMTFPGIRDAAARADLVAFLKQVSAEGASKQSPQKGGMMGGMGEPQLPDLKRLPAENRVQAIRYCRDSYFVTLATGETLSFWEFNLRFKTDSSSATGPSKDKPVMVGVGMRGDRAAIVFSNPAEISRFVQQRCE
ncbi:MAG TPA: cytochrome c family protein [Xanthobacteraceae bacterium]|nr:cytochrome c family protein [Xanthobacteraceae bacterium]